MKQFSSWSFNKFLLFLIPKRHKSLCLNICIDNRPRRCKCNVDYSQNIWAQWCSCSRTGGFLINDISKGVLAEFKLPVYLPFFTNYHFTHAGVCWKLFCRPLSRMGKGLVVVSLCVCVCVCVCARAHTHTHTHTHTCTLLTPFFVRMYVHKVERWEFHLLSFKYLFGNPVQASCSTSLVYGKFVFYWVFTLFTFFACQRTQ
jgi:hypothetical protein